MNFSQKITFVTVKTFDNIMDAHMLKSRLESEGIECFLFDKEIVALNTLYTWAVGGVKLKVLQKDVPKVIEVLKEISDTPLTNYQGVKIVCPNCESTKINTGHHSVSGLKGLFLAFLGFLTLTIPPFFKTRYYCVDCKHVFKKPK